MCKYYNSKVIRSKTDLDGNKPSIYMIVTNRSAGKTTHFLKLAIERRKEENTRCVLIYRRQNELNGAHLVFKDVCSILGIDEDLTLHSVAKGLFYEIFLGDSSLGYAISLSNVDTLKKYSPLFADCYTFIFDEFLTESGKYLNQEVEKLQSLLITCARGGGKQSREIEVFLLANRTSLLNPYYIYFDIHKRLKKDTHFLRGHGWIYEHDNIESASIAIKENGIYKAFDNGKSRYMKYSTEETYLTDTSAFIEKPKGRYTYLFTFIFENTFFSVKEYYDEGLIYVSEKYDPTFPTVISFKPKEHNQHMILLNRYCSLWKYVKNAFNQGFIRFDNIKSKNAIFDILSIDIYK